jgi:Zn-dependent M28 family amino/carboxypeptidase
VARSLEPGDEVSLSVDSTASRGTVDNVIAEAGKGRRVVMAGAHLDSVPAGLGINDNASGVATLLEVADALGPHPRGRTRIAFWAAEELGLVGSRHYVRTLPRERREEIAAYLNLDMVGSPNAVPSVYSDADERLTRVLRRAHPGREAGVPAEGRSDHGPLADAGIAVGGFYTGAQEPGPGGRPRDPCYHLPCDTLADVDRRVLLRMARATATALREIEDEP